MGRGRRSAVLRIIFRHRRRAYMKSRATTSRGFLVICLGFCAGAWCQQEPAGEGRPITPAGTLVVDAATHFPAVGAMPMAMVPSPDALGQSVEHPSLLALNTASPPHFTPVP